MTEISKGFRTMLIVTISVAVIYAIPFMFMIRTWSNIIGYTYSSPWFAQFFGLTIFLIAIWLLRAILQKKSFEELTYFVEFLMAILGGMLIYFTLELVFVSDTPATRIFGIIGTAITGALLGANMIFYFIETAKNK
ncbi:MAG: hypothetical protein ACTSRE_15030 [Promethearchaeota archaeon]